MSAPLPSSAPQRIRRCRSQLVIEMARRDGLFWNAVQAIRTAWGISPSTAVPRYDVDDNGMVSASKISVPSVSPAKPPSSPLRPRYTDNDGPEFPSLATAIQLPREWGACGLAWWLELKHLHDWFMPEGCRSPGDSLSWSGRRLFRSACFSIRHETRSESSWKRSRRCPALCPLSALWLNPKVSVAGMPRHDPRAHRLHTRRRRCRARVHRAQSRTASTARSRTQAAAWDRGLPRHPRRGPGP
jgi:hypothetical protein